MWNIRTNMEYLYTAHFNLLLLLRFEAALIFSRLKARQQDYNITLLIFSGQNHCKSPLI